MKTKKTIGFIGGEGKMAKLFIPVFKKHGFNIIISDKNTKLTNGELVEKSDIVIISVPMIKTKEVIREIIPFTKKDQILMDFTSLKKEPVSEMLKGKAEVIGLHPMFGPNISQFKGQRMIMCPARTKNQQFISDIFENEGLDLHVTGPDNHDKMMGIIQVLIHFHSILLGNTLRSLNVNLKEVEKFMSPIYQLEFGVISRIFSQDPDLYGPILMMNPKKDDILDSLKENSEDLINIITKLDMKSFKDIFTKTSKYLGGYKKMASRIIGD